jgi:flagella basal body P-ring formation protein FlgA
MKKNMVPLLGIAFIVAIISTGVFYGLFAGKLRSSSELPSHGIVVAARDLDRGTVIQASDLRISEIKARCRAPSPNRRMRPGLHF